MPTDTIFREYDHTDSDHSDRSANDRLRHRELVREKMKEGISDILSDESIIGQSGDKIIKVPIKGIREYRFVFGDNSPDATSGNGEERPGDVIGKRHGHKPGSPGNKAGHSGGDDVIETDVTLDELIDIMFEDLGLPDMERKSLRELVIESVKRSGYRRKGIRARLDPKRTIAEKMKRQLATKRMEGGEETLVECEGRLEQHTVALGEWWTCPVCKWEGQQPEDHGKERFPFRNEDLRYKHMKIDKDYESNAVVICIMDVSGSMDQVKKYLARAFFFLLWTWVRRQYQRIEVVFIAHHDTAKEVSQEEFFHRGESGGTVCSTGYEKALEIIHKRYHPSLWNIYAFHCSDGDNWGEDNAKCLTIAKELLKVCKLFGYGEIVPTSERSTLFNILFGRQYEYETLLKIYTDECQKYPEAWAGFFGFRCSKKSDIWPMFKMMLDREKQ